MMTVYPTTAQVPTKPTADMIRQLINSIFGPTRITLRQDGNETRIFIPGTIVDSLKTANMWSMLGLEKEEKVVTDPTLRAFKV